MDFGITSLDNQLAIDESERGENNQIEDGSKYSKTIEDINNKLRVRDLSPIRYSSPFSKAHTNNKIEEYIKADTPEKKLDIRAKPTPFLRVKSADRIQTRSQVKPNK